jgi:hypothetical protein
MSNQANGTPTIDPVTGPIKILLDIPDSELSTRALARRFNLSQPVVARRLQQARSVWDHTRRREFWMLLMYALLTVSALLGSVSLAIIAATGL